MRAVIAVERKSHSNSMSSSNNGESRPRSSVSSGEGLEGSCGVLGSSHIGVLMG